MAANCSGSRFSGPRCLPPTKNSTVFIGYDAGWASAGRYWAAPLTECCSTFQYPNRKTLFNAGHLIPQNFMSLGRDSMGFRFFSTLLFLEHITAVTKCRNPEHNAIVLRILEHCYRSTIMSHYTLPFLNQELKLPPLLSYSDPLNGHSYLKSCNIVWFLTLKIAVMSVRPPCLNRKLKHGYR
jgi:hypothetical protein